MRSNFDKSADQSGPETASSGARRSPLHLVLAYPARTKAVPDIPHLRRVAGRAQATPATAESGPRPREADEGGVMALRTPLPAAVVPPSPKTTGVSAAPQGQPRAFLKKRPL